MHADEKAIRTLIDRWVEQSCKGDLDELMTCYAPDVEAFDAILAFRFKGREAYRKHWEVCLGYMQGEMKFTIHDMAVNVDGDVAFCHYLAVCSCTMSDGKEESGWVRATICLRRIDGRWLIVHEHFSVPFDPESHKVLSEPEPEA